MKIVTYSRVSTDKQGRSGLGLEAQEEAIARYCQQNDAERVADFVEVESGKKNHRPELLKAIRAAKQHKAKLLVAKLDRLSRNAAFLLQLRDSNIEFVAADNPDANNLTIGILAVVAENERDMISQRTKAALAAAKARGLSWAIRSVLLRSVISVDLSTLYEERTSEPRSCGIGSTRRVA